MKRLNESKLNAADIVKILHNSSWDMGDRVWLAGDFIEVAEPVFGDISTSKKSLKEKWEKDGSIGKFFFKRYGITFSVADSYDMKLTKGKYRNVSKRSVVGIFFKII